MMDAAIPNMEAGKSSMCVFLVVTSSRLIDTRQFSSSFASISSMTPCSTRSRQEFWPALTYSMSSGLRSGLPLSTTTRGLRTRPEHRLM